MITPTRDNVTTLQRADRPHVSLYLGKKTQRVLREIAIAVGKRPHDIYIAGINLILRQYGRGSIDEIEGK
jgi:hypothetical protein